MLRLVLPKGSLERATLQLFEDADLAVVRGPRTWPTGPASTTPYRATCGSSSPGDPGLRRRGPVRPGHHRARLHRGAGQQRGLPGRAPLLQGHKQPSPGGAGGGQRLAGEQPGRAGRHDGEIPGSLRISSEYPELTRKVLAVMGSRPTSLLLWGHRGKGARIADAVVDMTETGSALRAAGLRIIETLLSRTPSSSPTLRRGRSGQAPRHGADPHPAAGHSRGRGKVLVKLNVSVEQLDAVLPCCPPCGRRPSRSSRVAVHLPGGRRRQVGHQHADSGAARPRGPPTFWRSPSPKSCIDVGGPVPAAVPRPRARRLVRRLPGASARWPRTAAPPTASMPRRSPTGSRRIAVGAEVTFTVAPGHGGLYEARSLVAAPVPADSHHRPA